MVQIETMELANGVIVREHGRTRKGPNEVESICCYNLQSLDEILSPQNLLGYCLCSHL